MLDRPDRADCPPVLLAGPTAVGKSAVALRLAEVIGGEIISVDSMQVYRGLDLGTAKPSAADQARVQHHLIDVASLAEPFDAAQFVRLASAAVRDTQARGRIPILCGGTGLYFKAWLEGLGDAPPANPRLRAELAATPLAELLRELKTRDPATFARIDPQNPRRVIRAMEVIRLTGRPFSEQRADWNLRRDDQPPLPRGYALQRSAVDLRARLGTRVDAMFAAGLVDETRALLHRGLAGNRTAMQAIGYRQVVEHLRGERGLAETMELVKTRTRQFAKRQMTWFRRQMPLSWLTLDAAQDEAGVARTLAGAYQRERSNP